MDQNAPKPAPAKKISRREALKRAAGAVLAVAAAGVAAGCMPTGQNYGGYSSTSGGYSYSSYGSVYGSYSSVFYDRGGPDNAYHSQFTSGTNQYYTSYSS